MSLSPGNNVSPSAFPSWVVRKIGIPFLTEADWNQGGGTFPNAKFGMFAASTGTLTRETANFFNGGAASIKLLTAATSNDSTELKYSHDYCFPAGWLLSLEQKSVFAPVSGGTGFDIGIEARQNKTGGILHARFRWTNATGEWKYEDNALVYQSFPASIGGPLVPEKSSMSTTSGTKWTYQRVVIDPYNSLYVGFEASGSKGKLETRDMRSMALPLTAEGNATAWEILYFTLLQNGAASVETAYVTDWCISVIPPTIDPFAPLYS